MTSQGIPGNTEFDRRLRSLRSAIRSLLLQYSRAGQKVGRDPVDLNPVEGRMSANLQFLEEWIPEKMDPGTIFVLENQSKLGNTQNPYVAVMSCPR